MCIFCTNITESLLFTSWNMQTLNSVPLIRLNTALLVATRLAVAKVTFALFSQYYSCADIRLQEETHTSIYTQHFTSIHVHIHAAAGNLYSHAHIVVRAIHVHISNLVGSVTSQCLQKVAVGVNLTCEGLMLCVELQSAYGGENQSRSCSNTIHYDSGLSMDESE